MEDGNGPFFIFLTECVFGEGALLHKPFLILSVFLPHTAQGSSKARQCLSACTGTDPPDWAGPYTTQHLFAPAQNITFLPEWEKTPPVMSKWTPCRTLPKWRTPCQGTDSCPFSSLKNVSNATQSRWPRLVCSPKFSDHQHFLFSKEPWWEASHLSDAILQSHMRPFAISKLSLVPTNQGWRAEVHLLFSACSADHEGLCQKLHPHTSQLALGCQNEPLSPLRSFRSQKIYIKCLNHVQTSNTIGPVLSLSKQRPNKEAINVGNTSTNLHYQKSVFHAVGVLLQPLTVAAMDRDGLQLCPLPSF